MHVISNFMTVRHEYIPRDLIYGGNQSLSESMSYSVPVQPPVFKNIKKKMCSISHQAKVQGDSLQMKIFKGNCQLELN